MKTRPKINPYAELELRVPSSRGAPVVAFVGGRYLGDVKVGKKGVSVRIPWVVMKESSIGKMLKKAVEKGPRDADD